MNPAPPPRLILPSHRTRETFLAIAAIAAILAVLVWGIARLGDRPAGNKLTGKIIAKEFTPMKEEVVEFKGRHLQATRASEGEFVLKVRVDGEGGRVFDVPVSQAVFKAVKEGDPMSFMRPAGEQR